MYKLPIVLIVVAFGWLRSEIVVAQTASENAPTRSESATYRAAVERGLEEFGLGNFEEAREQFAQAHKAFPNARTLRGLGMSEFELRNYVEAAEYLHRALADRTKALEGKSRSDTEALLERTRGYVGQIEFDVEPMSTTIIINGRPRTLGKGAQLRLDVGAHTVELQAEGYVSATREVTVRGGQTERLAVKLLKKGSALASASDSSSAPDRVNETPVYKRWWLWTLVGVVVAGAAAGTYVALTYKKEQPEYSPAPPTPNTPPGLSLAPLIRY